MFLFFLEVGLYCYLLFSVISDALASGAFLTMERLVFPGLDNF